MSLDFYICLLSSVETFTIFFYSIDFFEEIQQVFLLNSANALLFPD